MLLAVKIISALFALLGVTELATQVKYKKSSIIVVRDLSVDLFNKFNDHFFQKRGPAFAPVDDEVEHRQSWNYHDEEHDDYRQRFHEAMQYKMTKVRSCHKACGGVEACHKACPTPWAKFQEQCGLLKPIWVCHQECHHSHGSHSCHAQCPKPQSPVLARKMEKTMQCHQKCGHGDHTCHHACPRPMAHIESSCTLLQDTITCHGMCTPGDHTCHHACPKMWSLWHLDRKVHDNAQGFHHDDHHFHSPEEDHTVEHRQWWNYHGKEQDKMKVVMSCHKACGMDVACHKACPNPWAKFQEKCEALKPIWVCHKECHHSDSSHSCHAQCPKPSCPKLAGKMEETMQCHQKCGHGDHTCHYACPSPMAHIETKCTAMQDTIACHGKCTPGDHMCYHTCPKMWSLWHLDGKEHDEAQRFHYDDHHDHSPEEDDEARHQKWWGYHGEEHQVDHRSNFHGVMAEKMHEVEECHKQCGWEHHRGATVGECHETCPKPWEAQRFHHDDHHDHSSEEDDEARHQKWWGYHGEEHQVDHRSNFHSLMAEKMHKVKECHKQCGWDLDCHKSCPKPWEHFQDNCDKLKPIYECHEQCHAMPKAPGDCHSQCPKPQCPKMAQELLSSLKCHQECGHHKVVNFLSHKCHSACPHTMVHMQQRCGALQHITGCHQKCGPMDFKCHGSCMKMHDLWHLSGGQPLVTIRV